MAYIVPSELPQTCNECAFCACKFSFPHWATDRGDLCGKQGFYCSLDTQDPRRVMVVDFGDKTKKMEWCPLKEVVYCKDCKAFVRNERVDTDRGDCYRYGIGCVRIKKIDDFCSYGERRTE